MNLTSSEVCHLISTLLVNLTDPAQDLLNNSQRRSVIQTKLDAVIAGLGEPGAPRRAAALIAELAPQEKKRI